MDKKEYDELVAATDTPEVFPPYTGGAELVVIDDSWVEDKPCETPDWCVRGDGPCPGCWENTTGRDVKTDELINNEAGVRHTLAAVPGQTTLQAAQALVMAQEAWCQEAHRLAAIVDKVLVAVPQDYGCDFEADDEVYRQGDRRTVEEIYKALYLDPATGEYQPPCPTCRGTGRERKTPTKPFMCEKHGPHDGRCYTCDPIYGPSEHIGPMDCGKAE